jgi:IclR family acetate operon transcriptional repressor
LPDITGRQAATVDAILRAFTIVEHLAERRDGLTVTALARLEDVNKALTHRALASLMQAGYVVQDEGSQRYRLTPRLLALAMGYYDALGLRGVAGPILQAAADATGCNAEFTRLMDGELRILMWVPPQQRVTGLRIVSRPGDTQAPHATAAGKIWLASLDEPELASWLDGRDLPALGPGTITTAPALREELRFVRDLGYALNREEDGHGVYALAVPIRTPDQTYLGSLGLTRPFAGTTVETVTRLREVASEAAAHLGAVLPRGEELLNPTTESF